MVDIELIKCLRKRTSLSLGLCKKALEESNSDLEEAIVLLQKWGELKAAKKAGSETGEGRIHSYLHHDGTKACLVEVGCETDFAAKSPDFIDFCETLCLQIISMSPKYLNVNDISENEMAKQRDIFEAQVPEKVETDKRPHIVNGKMKKWFGEVCLLDQKVVLPEVSGKTIEQLRADLVAKLNENIVVKRFVHWEI